MAMRVFGDWERWVAETASGWARFLSSGPLTPLDRNCRQRVRAEPLDWRPLRVAGLRFIARALLGPSLIGFLCPRAVDLCVLLQWHLRLTRALALSRWLQWGFEPLKCPRKRNR